MAQSERQILLKGFREMIQAVGFDVGGVLVRTEDPTPRRALERPTWGSDPGKLNI